MFGNYDAGNLGQLGREPNGCPGTVISGHQGLKTGIRYYYFMSSLSPFRAFLYRNAPISSAAYVRHQDWLRATEEHGRAE